MRADDLLMAFAAAGVALTCLYMVSEFLSWKAVRASDQSAVLILRDLYKKLHATGRSLHASGTKLHAATKPFTKSFTRPFTTRPIRPK
jgi:hypothetical protein